MQLHLLYWTQFHQVKTMTKQNYKIVVVKMYPSLIFDKGGKGIQWKKDNLNNGSDIYNDISLHF